MWCCELGLSNVAYNTNNHEARSVLICDPVSCIPTWSLYMHSIVWMTQLILTNINTCSQTHTVHMFKVSCKSGLVQMERSNPKGVIHQLVSCLLVELCSRIGFLIWDRGSMVLQCRFLRWDPKHSVQTSSSKMDFSHFPHFCYSIPLPPPPNLLMRVRGPPELQSPCCGGLQREGANCKTMVLSLCKQKFIYCLGIRITCINWQKVFS